MPINCLPGNFLWQFFVANWFAGVSAPPENADGEINIDEMFSINGRNAVDPTGPKLREVVPNGKLSNLNDRWAWIDNGQNGMLQIWLRTSTDIAGFTEVNRENLNGLYFWVHAAIYSQLPTFDDFHLDQFPPRW